MSNEPFPFSAVVGQEDAQQALLLAAVDPAIGGVLLRGEKGSAKSTLARGLAGLLQPDAPFVELPVGATEDRVLGSLDVRSLVDGDGSDPAQAFRPGLLAAAHGGALYVDEVNLLPDQIVDGLLDAAASGVNRVERDGVSHEHPARFVLLGSMNPEEGELRPQLLDRFGLAVEVCSSEDPAVRAEAVRRRLAHDEGRLTSLDIDDDLRERLAAARPADLPDRVVTFAATLAVTVRAESLRADLVLCRAAAALAGWEERDVTTEDDVARIAHLALGHRRRRRPFDPPTLPTEELAAALETTREAIDGSPGDGGPRGDDSPSDPHQGKGSLDTSQGDGQGNASGGSGGGNGASRETGHRWEDLAGDALNRGSAPMDLSSDRPRPRPQIADGATGRLSGHAVPGLDGPRGVAVLPTVRAMAERRAADPDGPTLHPDDVREPRRFRRERRTIVLVVDTSGSMGTASRVSAATGAVLGLLADAYLARDQVALVAFRGDEIGEVLPPTASVELARLRLADLPTGGSTPLAEGISAGLATAQRAVAKESTPLLVVLTDGRATGPPEALDRARAAARAVADAGVEAMILDAEDGHGSLRLGLAAELAELMNGRCLPLSSITAPEVEAAVRQSL